MDGHADESRKPPGRPNWAVLAFVVSAGALILAGASWYQSNRAIEELADQRRALAAGLASSQRAPVIDLTGAEFLGADDAVVTLVEFSDYECPFCIRHFQQTMPRIVQDYVNSGRIRYAFRDWPVDQLHPQAIRAHEAAHCAGEQNRFWAMHPRLFGPPGSHSPEQLIAHARELRLDMNAFTACVASGRSTAEIRATGRQAVDLGATGTPAFFIGVRDRATNQVTVMQGLTGAQPYEVFARALDGVLAQVK